MRNSSFVFALLIVFSCSSSEQIGQTSITLWKGDKKGAISITYDDATINQFRQALPIMDTLQFKGTFFINTADIPGSIHAPKFIGRSIREIVMESAKIPTTETNLFERGSALRFLDIPNAIDLHNIAGAAVDKNDIEVAIKTVEDAFNLARQLNAFKEIRPVLLTGDLITWPEIKVFAASGHEFGNHTISHPRLAILDEANLLYEMEKCKEEIQTQLGVAHTFSAECPFGTENERVMNYAYNIHPALRNRMPETFLEELSRWNTNAPASSDKEYVQWQRGPLQKTSMELMKSWVDTLMVHDNVWLVLTFHGVDGVGWEAKPHQELKEYFSYMKSKEADLWIATFGEVTKYIRQRMNSKIDLNINDDVISIKSSHNLDSTFYNLPMTFKTYVNHKWNNIVINQGKQNISYRRGVDEKGSYLLFDALLNKEIVITSTKE
jgi:peptidoglycan/xylan/chitin deacetylase (PgdA/CDA1 family)